MTNRKNYNSILFLTVYLGLVLVGATPQVLAHAATNSMFDLRNEIEYKDDLDTKPDDEINDFLSLQPDEAIAEFIEELKKLKQADRKISGRQISESCFHTWVSEDESSASIGYPTKLSNASPALSKLWQRYENLLANKSYKSLPSFFKNFENRGISFSHEYVFNAQNLKIQFNFSYGSVEEANIFSQHLNSAFATKVLLATNRVTKKTYENTKAIYSNGYVTVITNLPRSSIDSLIK